MKTLKLLLLASALISAAAVCIIKSRAAEQGIPQVVEFVTIRWDGRENTRLVRSNGKVERLKPLFERLPRPDGIDERSYYLNVAMNAVAREGYDLAAMTSDQIVMKRSLGR